MKTTHTHTHTHIYIYIYLKKIPCFPFNTRLLFYPGFGDVTFFPLIFLWNWFFLTIAYFGVKLLAFELSGFFTFFMLGYPEFRLIKLTRVSSRSLFVVVPLLRSLLKLLLYKLLRSWVNAFPTFQYNILNQYLNLPDLFIIFINSQNQILS
jgi:hypothetical protein